MIERKSGKTKNKTVSQDTFFCIHFTIVASLISRILQKWSHLKLATNNTGEKDDENMKGKKKNEKISLPRRQKTQRSPE